VLLFGVTNIWINNLIRTPCLFMFCLFQESSTDVYLSRETKLRGSSSILTIPILYDVIVYIKIKMYSILLHCRCCGKNMKPEVSFVTRTYIAAAMIIYYNMSSASSAVAISGRGKKNTTERKSNDLNTIYYVGMYMIKYL